MSVPSNVLWFHVPFMPPRKIKKDIMGGGFFIVLQSTTTCIPKVTFRNYLSRVEMILLEEVKKKKFGFSLNVKSTAFEEVIR